MAPRHRAARDALFENGTLQAGEDARRDYAARSLPLKGFLLQFASGRVAVLVACLRAWQDAALIISRHEQAIAFSFCGLCLPDDVCAVILACLA